LGDELCSALGLHRVVVTSAESQPLLMAAAVDELGRVGLRADDVLLLGWGRTMSAIATARLPSLSGVRIVPAVGGMDERERPFHSNEIVRHAAEHSGATPHLLHAPAAPTPALRQALLADDAVDAVVGLWDRLDAALVGIGVPPGKPGSFTPGHVLTNGARDALSRAAGDIVTRYFDLAGAPVAYPAEQRLLAVSREQLRQARTRIGVAAGQDKHRAIVGAARAGLIDVLVTDGPTAAAALELAGATA
jgi:DNA-binding transcriptional regulator LsrR (DeoR family)